MPDDEALRRRLLDLGVLPGCLVMMEQVAPFGDPISLVARGCRFSLRLKEAGEIEVE